ncbi:hypothetical protein ACFVFF_23210 [Streptomyces sp. NPDC057680]|uniref:hypothetical protein n=1 Tax=Streptomyces sp. NPDC057680 TaxID=3346208 RepID=UPI00368E94FF
MITADQALAAACEGLAVLEAQKRQGDPEAAAQLEALLPAAALIARDIREESR